MANKEATEKDYNRLVDFWNENSGWDIINRTIWENRFINNPKRASTVLFIEKDQQILAILIFIYMDITIGDRIVNGCRPFASVVAKSVRNLSGIKYMAQLVRFGYKNMREKGIDIIWMLPNPRWRHIAKLVDIEWVYYPLYKIDKKESDLIVSVLEDEARIISFDHPEIEGVWQNVQAQGIISVVRNQKVLKWKNSHKDYKLIGLFKDERLIGVASFIEKLKEKQIQICDVLIGNANYQEFVFTKVVELLKWKYKTNPEVKKFVILVTTQFEKSLSNVGFVDDEYKFVFAFKRLNKNISTEDLNISNWYLSAND